MQSLKRWILLGLFPLVLGLTGPALGQEYPVQPGDLLRITVFDSPELTTETKVSAGGRIAFPLIGEIEVTGLTPSETQSKIATMLRGSFIKNPLVTVVVVRQQVTVNLLGEFTKPGLLEVPQGSTLLEVLSLGGGLKPSAGDKLIFLRKTVFEGESQPVAAQIEVKLGELLEGRSTRNNFPVAHGDSLFVPRAAVVRRQLTVNLLGEFMKPGLLEVPDGSTLLEVISLGGGLKPSAGETLVLRRKTLVAAQSQPVEEQVEVPLGELLEGRSTKDNLTVAHGDSLFVPRAPAANKQLAINLLGEFIKPGLLEVPEGSTLLEVISLGGGLKASAGDLLVFRRKTLVAGQPQPVEEQIEVQLGELLEGRGAGNNFTVSNGDSLYVPRASFVFVSGAVKAPGLYKISSGLTVFRSITLAGGFTARAAKGRVRIIRKSEAGDVEVKVKMDDVVLPDDVVVVPEGFF